MPMYDVYAERKTAEVMQDTWGHLAPKPRKPYKGTMLFTLGEYGDITPIRVRFATLPDSPWFYEGMMDYLGHLVDRKKIKAGKVYLFNGVYLMLKNGEHRFRGPVRQVDC